MADFCVQCSSDLGAPVGYSDFEERPAGYNYDELCEGCGHTKVNGEGKCVWDCLKHHAMKPTLTPRNRWLGYAGAMLILGGLSWLFPVLIETLIAIVVEVIVLGFMLRDMLHDHRVKRIDKGRKP